MNKITLFLSLFTLSVGAGAELFKASDRGNILSKDANEFSCVLDSKTKLVWEVKSSKKGLQDKQNTYTWFDGDSGVENGKYSHNCNWGENCNTAAFVNAINNENVCKINSWRLPSEAELRTLIVYGDEDLLINTNFFPNTKLKSYWSSDQMDENIAIDVPFFYGGVKSSDKSFDAHIRLVSDAK
tara:strand:+ start:355 stop:906 length:552 start_codon:yes stop_codon:yes gene_type:complete